VYCAYGVEANPDANTYGIVTSTLIDSVAAAVCIQVGQPELIPWIEAALVTIEGTVLQQPDCTTLPPPTVPLDLSTIVTFSQNNILAWFHSAYWHYF
jgi:hypothetical protein